MRKQYVKRSSKVGMSAFTDSCRLSAGSMILTTDSNVYSYYMKLETKLGSSLMLALESPA